jgi:hypothetical protein
MVIYNANNENNKNIPSNLSYYVLLQNNNHNSNDDDDDDYSIQFLFIYVQT